MMIFPTFDEPGGKGKFAVLYERYRHLMMKVACDVLEDPFLAEDAVHDAFLRVSKNMERIADPDTAATKRYLIVIARNCAIDLLRRRKIYRSHEMSLGEVKEADMTAWNQETELAGGVLDAFRNLPDIYRDVFLLKYSSGLDNAEIAEILEIPEGTVRQRVARGKRLIQNALKEMEV